MSDSDGVLTVHFPDEPRNSFHVSNGTFLQRERHAFEHYSHPSAFLDSPAVNPASPLALTVRRQQQKLLPAELHRLDLLRRRQFGPSSLCVYIAVDGKYKW